MAYHLDQIDPDERGGFYADEEEEEYAAPRSRRVLRIAGALVVMGMFAGGLWFAYTLGMRHTGGSAVSGEIPLIRADNRPIKVKPEKPGGMQIPDRDMFIYGQQRPQVEHLLPPPEQPMARPAPPPPSPNPPVAANSLPANPLPAHPLNPPVARTVARATADPGAVVGHPAASCGQQFRRPCSSSGRPAGRGQLPRRWRLLKRRSPPPVAHVARQIICAASTTAVVAGGRSSSRDIGHFATAGPEAEQRRAAGSAHASGMRLQLGAMRSESEARGQWEQIKRKNPDLLGQLSGTAIRADLGDKGTYYRIQTGPVTDPASADRICG